MNTITQAHKNTSKVKAKDQLSELLIRSSKKDQIAFKQLYELASPKLYSQALYLMKKPELAEDVLQESFIKIWNKADTYNVEKSKAMTWMATITRNKAFDKLRSLKLKPQEVDFEYEGLHFASTDFEPDNLEDLSQKMQQIREGLKQLKPEQRECILLSYYYGYTHVELSEKLNKPLGTVKAWIRRGMETLQPLLLSTA